MAGLHARDFEYDESFWSRLINEFKQFWDKYSRVIGKMGWAILFIVLSLLPSLSAFSFFFLSMAAFPFLLTVITENLTTISLTSLINRRLFNVMPSEATLWAMLVPTLFSTLIFFKGNYSSICSVDGFCCLYRFISSF